MLGKIIANRYKILEELNQDPLAALYKAQDQVENKLVFVAFLKEKAKARPMETLLRFKREQEQLSKLTYPSLLKIYSQGEFEGQDYIVNEYFDAILLSKFLLQPQNIGQPLALDLAVELILQVASALDHTHQNGLLHQFINSASILISPGLKTCKLTNFGYNLLTDISRVTQRDEIILTFGYLSPESSGILRRPIDARSDIYSLGILFYQLLMGRLPYTAIDVSTLIHQHIAQVPDLPSKLNSRIPLVIENIVLRLIAKDPQDRYQSLAGLIADLKEYQKQKAEGRDVIDFEIARSDKLMQLSFSTRLIGRDKELDLLDSALDQTKQDKGALCFVFGEPGIGKSRLVDELRGQIHGLGGIFCGGKCYQYEFRTPYKVFAESLDAYIEKVKRLSHEEQQFHIKRIKDALGELGGEVVKIAPAIVDLIGPQPKLVELDPDKEKIRFLITVTNFITALASKTSPLLMFLDDLQWADDGSLEILERVAEKLQNCAILLIVSYRDTEVDQSHPLAQLTKKLKERNIAFSDIPVKPFTVKDTGQMIGQILMEKEEDVSLLAASLYDRAKGNPFFTLELLHTLVDSNIVYLKNNHYICDLGKLKNANLPSSIVDAVLKRVEDLFESSLQTLSYASVMGKEVNFEMLIELTRSPFEQVLNSIEDGIRNQLLYRDLTGRESIFFMHDRIREAFYQRIPEVEKVPLHKHIAEILEEQHKDNDEPILYDLAYHFTKGQIEDKSLAYSIRAANKAKNTYANNLAISLYSTAVGILEKQGRVSTDVYMEVLEHLGETYRLAVRFDESLEVLRKCEALIPDQDKVRKTRVLAAIGDALFEKGELVESTKVIEQALRILNVSFFSGKLGVVLGILKEFIRQMFHTWFPKAFVSSTYRGTPQDLVVARLFNRLTHTYYFFDMNRTLYFLLKMLNLAEKMGPCPELTYAYTVAGNAWVTIPWFSRVLRDQYKGMNMAIQLGDKIREGGAYAYLSFTLHFFNRIKPALEYSQKAANLLEGLGEYWTLGVGYCYRNHNNWLLGRLKEGLVENEKQIALTREAKALQTLGWLVVNQGTFYYLLGEREDMGVTEIKEGLGYLRQVKDMTQVMYSTTFLAYAYLRRREYEIAVKTIEEAIAMFPLYYNSGCWTLIIFPTGAQIYFDSIINDHTLSAQKKKAYLKRAGWFCSKANFWSLSYKFFYGYTLQVNGTYLWLSGKKSRAIKTWDKGLHWLRTNKGNPGGDKYRIAYILLEEAKFLLQDNPKDKKAYSNLIEARDLFTEMGCKLDLDTTNKLLESISPEGISVDSRTVLTQKRHLDSLLSVTQAIGSIFILDELLQKILEYGLKVTGAERGFLLLYDQAKNLSLKVSSGLEKDLSGTSFSYDNYRISLELINEVANTKSASIADQQTASNAKIQNELKTFSVRQAIAVPLQTRDKPIGILYMDNRLAGGTFGKDELELMKGFAVQASVSIENAYLVSSLVEQERLKQELELGRQIQESLLPKESPVIQGLKLSGLMLPAKEIGGDYYDFVTPEDPNNPSVSIVIGDVSGKGVAAGLLMAMAKTAIHTLSQEETSPKQILLR
ncbi:MAG: AAA family ATPase, partial [Candidatus Omnitrophota bacterium]